MADEQAEEPAEQPNEKAEMTSAEKSGSRRRSLTPEQRRFLNKPRTAPNEPAREKIPPLLPGANPEREPVEPADKTAEHAEPERQAVGVAPALEAGKASRAIELQQALLILGALVVLGLAFYGGTKLNYLRYLIATRHTAKNVIEGPDPFPGVAPADLVQQALLSERAGKWEDAVERFMAAKRKDLGHRGILFRVGRILYDHRNFEAADSALERAIAFGENVEAADYYRGLIAVRRRDLVAAEQYFTAAIAAAPFVSDYQYYLADTLRLDLKPKEALPHYEQAALLARDGQDEAVCRFKMRMAKIEAAEGATVAAELEKMKANGPLPVDWLLTAAALQLKGGNIDQTRQLVMQAREAKSPGLFASCVNDFYFHQAGKKYPELADALHLELDLQVPFPD